MKSAFRTHAILALVALLPGLASAQLTPLEKIENERAEAVVYGGAGVVLGSILCPTITALSSLRALRRIGKSSDATGAADTYRRGRNVFLSCLGLAAAGSLGVAVATSPATLAADHPAFLALLLRVGLEPGSKEAGDLLAEIRSLDMDDAMELLTRENRISSAKEAIVATFLLLMIHSKPNKDEFLRAVPNLEQELISLSAQIDQGLRGRPPVRR